MFSRDLSWNQLTGPLPSNKLADNMTTMYVNSPTFLCIFYIMLLVSLSISQSLFNLMQGIIKLRDVLIFTQLQRSVQ